MKVTVRRAEAEDAAAIAVCLAALGYDTSTALVAKKHFLCSTLPGISPA